MFTMVKKNTTGCGGVIYARSETEEGLEAQLQACIKYCRKHGIGVVKIFTDLKASDTSPFNPSLVAMIQCCRINKVDVIVTKDLARITRCPCIGKAIINLLAQRSTKILPLDLEEAGCDDEMCT